MEDNFSSLQPQLGYNKKLGWYGTKYVLDTLSNLTSEFGVLNYELYKLTLKEYEKHRDVYDMAHNYDKLIRAKAVGILLSKCWYATTPMKEREFNIVNMAKQSYLPYHNILSIRTSSDKAFKLSHYSSYPSLPRGIALIFWDILEDVKGFIDIQGHSRKDIDLHTGFVIPAMEGMILSYYANWDEYQVNPELWFNKCIDIIRVQPFMEEYKAMVETKMSEIIQAHMAKGVKMVTHRSYSQIKAYGIFQTLLNIFR